MERFRLKNIIILILVLLNAFLLFSLALLATFVTFALVLAGVI